MTVGQELARRSQRWITFQGSGRASTNEQLQKGMETGVVFLTFVSSGLSALSGA